MPTGATLVLDQHVPLAPHDDEPPACLSPEAVDAKLKHLVGVYGSRWSLIRCHMMREFRCAFPARYLEGRWESMQPASTKAMRSPLTAISADTVQSQSQSSLHGGKIQERLPLQPSLRARSTPAKRWREQEAKTSQRAPPPPSPRTPPKELLSSCCPTFLLAPGSALNAPEAVRRQLKAVYLAKVLARPPAAASGTSKWGASRGSTFDGDLTCYDSDVDDDTPSATKTTAVATEHEKGAIVALLARELASFRGRRGVSPTRQGATSPDDQVSPLQRGSTSGGPAAEFATPKSRLSLGPSASATSLLRGAHRSGATLSVLPEDGAETPALLRRCKSHGDMHT